MFFAECCDAALIDTFKIPTAIVAVLVVSDGDAVIALRFPTGMFLAGVYPPGLKIATGWFRDQRGLALGILIGALTLGKAFPQLLSLVWNRIGEPMLVASG